MNEKNKLTNGSQSNQNEHNYPNSNSSDYNNFENNSSNQYYFEEENYNNNKNFENYNYNNQEQYYNNNYDSNHLNNSNYNSNNSQNPYYNNDYNQNMEGNNNQFSYENQEQYPSYYNNFDGNNEQIFYNNQEQFPNYNNDFNGNNEQNFYNNQEQFPNYNNDYNGNNEQIFYNNQEQFPNYNNDFNGNNEQNFYNNQEQFPNYNNDFNGNNEQNFYNNQEQYSNVEQNDSVSYPSTNSTLTDVPQEETQNTQDILMARELQKTQESEKYQEIQDNQEPSDNKPSKSKLGIIITSIIGLIILLSAGGYFAYNHINKNKEIAVNMSQYELEFTASGTEGEGKPSANIKNIPNVDNASDELKQLLQNPKISYDKNDNLRNGDKVEVSLSLDKSELNGKKIVIKDEFKRSFTVKGLKEKEKDKDKETTETKENSNNDSNSNSSDKSTSKTNSRVKEDSSVDTTKLSEDQVKNWVLASYIQLLPDMTKDDYIVSVSLHSDNLVYAGISENPNSSKHPSPKMLPTRYRINAKGELEASSRMTEDWRVISKVYMYVE